MKKAKQTELISQEWNGQTYIGVNLPWRGEIEIVARQSRFFDQVLALAGVPGPDQWPKILVVSQKYGMPLIWSRARPSTLENNAAALLTSLAFSNRKDWPRLIRDFLKVHDLTGGLSGRPRLDPRMTRDVVRGKQIDELIARLGPGFKVKAGAKRSGGFQSGDEQLTVQLKSLGYDEREITAIFESITLQNAACRFYYVVHRREDNCTLKAIQNSYARFKRLHNTHPIDS